MTSRAVLFAQAVGADIKDLLAHRSYTIRWDSTAHAWESARPALLPFGVIFLSTNDAAATAPPTTNLKIGDLWRRHPDAI